MLAKHPIKLTSTLSGQKEDFEPSIPNHVKIYACGVTVYDHCHIGHAMQAIFFDVIRQYFKFCGYKVTYVRNYTDVDDKIINRAKEMAISPDTLAADIIRSSEEDMKALGIEPADYEPKVSESIQDIIAMTEDLIKAKAAYATSDGDVYYRVSQKQDYGKLSNRNPSELRAGTREIAAGQKEDPLDFALWKHDTTPGASWQSPWGQGRPGWHIECSAMAKRYLGESFDIHGGGRDLVFPHHENEIAQSESANNCSYARYWLHSGLLTIDKQKMSKSLGNHISIKDFLKKWPAEVLRFSYLLNHYSSNIDFNHSVFQNSAKRLLVLYQGALDLQTLAQEHPDAPAELLPNHTPEAGLEVFHSHMSNDFCTTAALRDSFALLKQGLSLQKQKKSPRRSATAKAYLDVLKSSLSVLGLLKQDPEVFLTELQDKILPLLQIDAAEIENLITKRNQARAAKDYSQADAYRDQLSNHSIEIMDQTDKTTWRISFKDLPLD